MKKKRTIKIRDPKLIKVRNNLRLILHLAKSSVLTDLLEQQINIQDSSHFWDKKHPQYNEMRKEVQELASRANDLSYAYSASIIKCPVCMRIDKDMTYNPVLEKWFCIECYEKNKKLEFELVEEGELLKDNLDFP